MTTIAAAKLLANAFFYLERRQEPSTSAYYSKRNAQSILVDRINTLVPRKDIYSAHRRA